MQQQVQSAVFFDLDGVVIDSEPLITTLAAEVLAGRGISVDRELLEGFVGPPLEQSFTMVLRAAGALEPGDDVANYVTEFRSLYRERCLETRAQPGVKPMLEALAAVVPCGLATSKPREFASAIVSHLELSGLFTVSAAPEPAWASDDKTAVLTEALREMQVHVAGQLLPVNCLMVGDRRHDVEAAQSLGMLAMGVTWGVGSRAELVSVAPDFLVDDPAEVLTVVEALLRQDA